MHREHHTDTTFEIKSASGATRLTLAWADPDHIVATISDVGLTASASVYMYERQLPSSFFVEIARDWRGWEGQRAWAAIEGELSLTATSDKIGHVRLEVLLRNGVGDQSWEVNAWLTLEAGQLDSIARQVNRFNSRAGAA